MKVHPNSQKYFKHISKCSSRFLTSSSGLQTLTGSSMFESILISSCLPGQHCCLLQCGLRTPLCRASLSLHLLALSLAQQQKVQNLLPSSRCTPETLFMIFTHNLYCFLAPVSSLLILTKNQPALSLTSYNGFRKTGRCSLMFSTWT